MRLRRTPARLLAAATLVGIFALTGCSAGGEAPASPDSSVAAVSAPANTDGFAITAGSGRVDIQLWTDLSCPFCAYLEADIGELLEQWVADGEVTLTIHPLNFVSGKRGDTTDWSTRAANALAAVADAGQADRIPALYALLQEHQVSAEGAPTDDDILAFAAQAGVTADIADAVTSLRFGAWVSASNEHWLGQTIEGTTQVVQGVPILVVDGVVFEIGETNAARLQTLVEAALEA